MRSLPLRDGLKSYYYALTAHWGSWQLDDSNKRYWLLSPDLRYAQLIKHYKRRKLNHTEIVAQIGTLPDITQRLIDAGFSGVVNTSYVERFNCTLRCSLATLARRSAALLQSTDHLLQLLQLYRGYYHFCRPHESLALTPDQQPIPALRKSTPALSAGLTDHVWSLKEFLLRPVHPPRSHNAVLCTH